MLIPFTKDNIAQVPNCGGIYTFYNAWGSPIYVGRTSGAKGEAWGNRPSERYVYGLRHRLQSYYQKDDFSVHKTKHALRREIQYFTYRPINSEMERRYVEKVMKKGMKHNHG